MLMYPGRPSAASPIPMGETARLVVPSRRSAMVTSLRMSYNPRAPPDIAHDGSRAGPRRYLVDVIPRMIIVARKERVAEIGAT